MKFIPTWYDQDVVVATDPMIEASTKEEAISKAYTYHNGNPPAPMLYLEVINE